MARATVFNRDPAAQAQSFEAEGFEYLHVVDLDGAFAGRPVNARRSSASSKACRCRCSSAAASATWRRSRPGSKRASTASSSAPPRCAIPALVQEAARAFPGRIAVGLDARDGKVAVAGLGGDLRALRARDRAALRGCRRRRHHLHRHLPRRAAQGPQPRCHHRARRRGVDPGDRLGRPRLASTTSASCWSRAPPSSPAPSPAARSMTAGSMPARRCG